MYSRARRPLPTEKYLYYEGVAVVMLEIILISLAILGMAKNRNYGKKSYHRNYRLRRVRVAAFVTIGALDTLDVVLGNIGAATSGTLRVISVNFSYIWSTISATIDGGMQFGLAHSDYTAAEIEECLEVNASMDLGDKVAQEQANRLVRQVGTIGGTGTAVVGTEASFNDGKPMKTRLNWLLSPGDQIVAWIRNGSGTIWTTGSSLSIQGDIWVKDSA